MSTLMRRSNAIPSSSGVFLFFHLNNSFSVSFDNVHA